MQAFIPLALRYWKYGVMALLLMAVAVQSARLNSAKDKLELERAARVADRILAEQKAKEQKAETERNIIVYRDRVSNGGKVAERIERAELPGDCRTPDAVRSADL